MSEPAPALQARRGLRLGGRYELRSRIAVGGMGEVWACEDLALGRRVATKFLRPELAGDDRFLARLRAEARTSAPLTHPNIAALYDYGEDDGAGYLVMELVAGEPLADVLAREHVLAPDALLPILAQTARALHAAHMNGIVHRDVKPSNILLTPDGRVKITDFGISVPAASAGLTASGTVFGTAQYLAPEQAVGRPATPASDLYALGVVAFEALAGRRPFTGRTLTEIATAHVNDPVPDLPDFVPEPVRAVVGRMLEKDPERRPRSAASLARTLERIAKELEMALPFDERRTAADHGRHAGPHAEHGRHRSRGVPVVDPPRATLPVRVRAERGGVIEVTLPSASAADASLVTAPWSGSDDDGARPAPAVTALRAGKPSGLKADSGPPADPVRPAVPVAPAEPVVALPSVPVWHPVPAAPSSRASRRRDGGGVARRAGRRRRQGLARRMPWLWLVAAVAAVAIATALILAASTLERSVGSGPTGGSAEGRHVAAAPAPGQDVDHASGITPGHRTQIEDGPW